MKLRVLLLTALLLSSACADKPGDKPSKASDPAEIQVVSVSPEGTVRETSPIELAFSGPVVAEASVGQEAPGALRLTPSVPGRAVWIGRDRLRFVPSEPFPKAARIVVELVGLAPGEGRRLGGPTRFEILSQPLEVLSVDPFYAGAGAANVKVNVELTLPVSPEAARAKIHFATASGEAVQATLQSTSDAAVMAFELAAIPIPEGEGSVPLVVSVDEDLAPSVGGLPLGQKVVRQLALRGPSALVLEQAFPQQRGKDFSIVLRFNDEVDVDSVARSLSLKPALKPQVVAEYRGARIVAAFKAGTTYEVSLKPGLVGTGGGVLAQEIRRSVMIADLEPQLRFAHEGSYLSRGGGQKLAIESVNVPKVVVTVDKVFENNLVHVVPRLRSAARGCGDEGCWEGEYEYYGEPYYNSYYELGTFGAQVTRGTLELGSERNQWQTSNLPFPELDKDSRLGLYRVRVADAERSWSYVEKWVVSTDLGLTAKVGREEATVTVASLSTLAPVAGVELRFYSSTNQALGKLVTDAKGTATLSLAGQRDSEPLALITAQRGADFSYLALAGTLIPTADFDVGGEGDTTAPYEAYVYLDRGVYRPGDTAHLSVIVRGKQLEAPPVFPYTVEIRNPQWRLHATLRGSTDRDGLATFDVPFPSDALTGNYSVRVLGASEDAVLGRETIKVEEFMPDRIKVEVKPASAVAEAEQGLGFEVQSNYLFGPPAKGLRLESSCDYAEASIPGEWATTFAFNQDSVSPYRTQTSLGEAELDEAGHHALECPPVPRASTRRPVRVSVLATVSESGGRAVTGVASTLVHPSPYYVGVRRNSASYTAELGKSAELEAVAVDREGKAKVGVALSARFFRVDYRTVVKLVNGRNQYVSERDQTAVGEARFLSADRPVTIPFAPSAVGQYRVELSSEEGGRTAIELYAAGAGYAGWDLRNPDKIAMTADKASYAVGETAKIMVRAPFAGQLYLSVERDRVLWQSTVAVSGNSASVEVPVAAVMGPNAYVVAQLVRGPSSAEKLAPSRAFGVVPLMVRSDAHKLELELSAPESMRPRAPLELEVEAKGGKGAVQLTVAVVDEGILRITGFESPDPFKFFTRKRRLGIGTYDLFDALLPEVDGRATSLVRTQGGDAARGKHLNPVSVKRVKPLALWSGVVKLDAAGKARIKLDVPQFAGSVRVMAVAVEGDKFGAASANVTVKDPLVLTPTLPRFVGPLDRFTVPVEVFNGTGKAAELEVRLELEGRLTVVGDAARKLRVEAGAQELVNFTLQADEVAGKAKVTVRASGAGAETFSETELGIRPAATVSMDASSALVKAGQPLKVRVPSGYLPGTLEVVVRAGPTPAAQFGAALQYLIQYPYGCLEQTTSKTFPLLYLKDLARSAAPELASDGAIDQYVQAGISRIEGMALPSGGLSYWPGSGWGYAWTTVYATHFLVEAKRAGYAVDEANLKRLLDHLVGISNAGTYTLYGAPADYRTQAYALYVLAVAGRPNGSTLSYAVDVLRRAMAGTAPPLLRAWNDEETKAFVAGALLLAGDRARAQDFVSTEFTLSSGGRYEGFWSAARADAVILSVLAEVQPDHRSVPKLMKALIDRASKGYWYNTQENAFAMLALGKISKKLGQGEYQGTIALDGATLQPISSKAAASVRGGDDWVGKELVIDVQGAGSGFASVSFEGIKAAPMPARSKGMEVERAFFDKAGRRLDGGKLEQGQVVFVRLGVRTPGATRVENVALVDLLPAGLEIENPRLGASQLQPWMGSRFVSEYSDIRDDRILMFVHVAGGAWQYYWYAARAVTEGEFVLPHAHAEAMYDPETQAQAGAGRLVVSPRE